MDFLLLVTFLSLVSLNVIVLCLLNHVKVIRDEFIARKKAKINQETRERDIELQERIQKSEESDAEEQDADFIRWLKEEKSKNLEKFADPQWVRKKIATGVLDLDRLREEYQEYQQKQNEVKVDIQEHSSWLPSSFRKRTISDPKGNKSSQQETHELMDLQNQKEQLETNIQILPKN